MNIPQNKGLTTSKLSYYKDIIWPIESHELPKFLLMTFLMFCILFNQNVVRALKDSIIITNVGTETITFLKFWGVMPASFLMAGLYVKMINNFKSHNVFYILISGFMLFFALFAFIIFPNKDFFHLNAEKTNELINIYPNLKWFIILLANWSFSLFYIIAELWPSTAFSLLFWQFANQVTTVSESKRFYGLFGLIGQTGLYISGSFLQSLPKISEFLIHDFEFSSGKTQLSLQVALSLVLFFGIASLIIFRILNTYIVNCDIKFKSKEKKLSIIQSFSLVFNNKYILLIASLLFCYGVAINLVEGPWKSILETLYPNTEEYAAFVGGYLKYTGIFTVFFVVVCSNIIRKIGWYSAAMVTPLMVFSTGIIFFLSSNFKIFGDFIGAYYIITDPLVIAAIVGGIQNVLSKSAKYTLFDATKEMSYVPLPDELKTKGKAAADLIGTKLGKSTSAFLQSLVFMIVPSMTYSGLSFILMFIFIAICFIWIFAVKQLSSEYAKLCQDLEKSE